MAAQWIVGLFRRISQLTEVTSPSTSEFIPVTSSGAVKKLSLANLGTVIGAVDALVYKGATDCSSNPNYPAADAGHIYMVSVAGKIGGASGVSVEAGDMFICKTDGTLAGTQAQRGTSWNVIQSNIVNAAGIVNTPAGTIAATDVQAAINELDAAIGAVGGVALETPTGAVNGINDDFVFTSPPVAVFYQGVLQEAGGVDYSLAGSTVTFIIAPQSGLVKGLV